MHDIMPLKLFTLLPLKKTNNNKHVICQLHNVQLQKEVKFNPKQLTQLYKKMCICKNAAVKTM